MLLYELYAFKKKKGFQLIGVLPERRMNPARITKDSIINWVRMLSDDDVDGKDIFFKPIRIDLKS